MTSIDPNNFFEMLSKKGAIFNLPGEYADLNGRASMGETSLHALIEMGQEDENKTLPMVEFLISKGAKVDALCVSERSPLHVAATFGMTKTALVLLENGASSNLTDCFGHTPQAMAEKNGHISTLDALRAWEAKKASHEIIGELTTKPAQP